MKKKKKRKSYYDKYGDKSKPNHMRQNSPRVPMTSRVDLLSLANVARYLMLHEGEKHVTKSELVNQIVKAMSNMLIRDGKVRGVEDLSEAVSQLKMLGMDFMSNEQVKHEIHNKLSYESKVANITNSGSPYKSNTMSRKLEQEEMERVIRQRMEEEREAARKEQEEPDDVKNLAKKKAGIDDAPVAPMIPEDMRADLAKEVERNEGEDK